MESDPTVACWVQDKSTIETILAQVSKCWVFQSNRAQSSESPGGQGTRIKRCRPRLPALFISLSSAIKRESKATREILPIMSRCLRHACRYYEYRKYGLVYCIHSCWSARDNDWLIVETVEIIRSGPSSGSKFDECQLFATHLGQLIPQVKGHWWWRNLRSSAYLWTLVVAKVSYWLGDSIDRHF